MYYHVIIELGKKFHENDWDRTEIKADLQPLDEVVRRFTEPYQIGTAIVINGRSLPIDHIERLRVFCSDSPSKALETNAQHQREAQTRNSNVTFIGFYQNDLETGILEQKEITDDLILYAKGTKKEIIEESKGQAIKPNKVFIVHGHDDGLLYEVKSFLASLSIEPIILREQHDASLTIIEKLEKYIKDQSIGFGIVLYTADDEGKALKETEYRPRARQNVIFEHGLLTGLYGRTRVTTLVKRQGDIEMPSDIQGIVYTDHSYKDWRIAVAHMLEDAGYTVNYRKIS